MLIKRGTNYWVQLFNNLMLEYTCFYSHESERSSDCYVMPSRKQLIYIMGRTSYISMKWAWCPLCTRQTWSVEFL